MATKGGGGIECNYASPIITYCTVSYNSAEYGGGIACNNTSSATISDCTISYNTAENRGGISCWESSPTIERCIISNNKATDTSGSGAGGIACYSGSSATINACTIIDNIAQWGGGIKCYQSSPTITNCLITGNTVTGAGGGIECNGSSPTITNCTISGNKTINTSGAGGISCTLASYPILKNCIFWGNSLPEVENYESSPVFNYSDIEGGFSGGTGNIDADPLFVGSSNYRLTASSPCIDSGTSDGAPDTDIEGTTRPQGSGYDMGAYEYTLSTCPDCSGDEVILQGVTFPSGVSCQCIGTVSITIGARVTVPNGAKVTFEAPTVTIQDGFGAKEVSTVYIKQE